MNIRNLNFGIIHSIVGKNDGVSIVIDQSVKTMTEHMNIPLGNIHFLASYSPPRFNTTLKGIFWHKNEINRKVVEHFASNTPSADLEKEMSMKAREAKKTIEKWVIDNKIDFIIAHNVSHPYNFTASAGLGMFLEERRLNDVAWPKCLVWWHDSFFERPSMSKPGKVMEKYIKYVPGIHNDGIIFINSYQPELAKKYFVMNNASFDIENFFQLRTGIIPNTFDILWDWEKFPPDYEKPIAPPQEEYNNTFFRDIGLNKIMEARNFSMENAVFLLQHTRIVPRKRIDKAIDLAFMLEKKFIENNMPEKFIVLLLSGHSGDEQAAYKEALQFHYHKKSHENPHTKVIMLFGEEHILSAKDIVVDKKFYEFGDIPAIIASKNGIGTYFSEIEGFGNNLLEMAGGGLPAIINTYDVYRKDIQKLNFKFASVENCEITEAAVNEAFKLLTDTKYRNETVKHNLRIIKQNLSHHVIAEQLGKAISNIAVMNSV